MFAYGKKRVHALGSESSSIHSDYMGNILAKLMKPYSPGMYGTISRYNGQETIYDKNSPTNTQDNYQRAKKGKCGCYC